MTETETERQPETQTDGETETETDRETETERHRETETDRETEKRWGGGISIQFGGHRQPYSVTELPVQQRLHRQATRRAVFLLSPRVLQKCARLSGKFHPAASCSRFYQNNSGEVNRLRVQVIRQCSKIAASVHMAFLAKR